MKKIEQENALLMKNKSLNINEIEQFSHFSLPTTFEQEFLPIR